MSVTQLPLLVFWAIIGGIIGYSATSFYLGYQKWYIIYSDGHTSRRARSKQHALAFARHFDGVEIFCIVNIFGIQKTISRKVLDNGKPV